jgi:hypothetical protein
MFTWDDPGVYMAALEWCGSGVAIMCSPTCADFCIIIALHRNVVVTMANFQYHTDVNFSLPKPMQATISCFHAPTISDDVSGRLPGTRGKFDFEGVTETTWWGS